MSVTVRRVESLLKKDQIVSGDWTFAGDITASGISFGNENLEDYDEGSFTPILLGLGTAGTPTYVQQVGRYTRIGNMVFFDIRLRISNKGGMAGDVAIGGLPFTISNAGVTNILTYMNVAVGFGVTTTNDGYNLVYQADDGEAFFKLQESDGTTLADIDAADLTDTARLRFSGFYTTS